MANSLFGIRQTWNWVLCLTFGFASSVSAQEEGEDLAPRGLNPVRLLGEIELSANPLTPAAVRHVETFAIDARGRFVFLRWWHPATLVVLDGDSGQVVSEILVPSADLGSALYLQDPDQVLVSRGRWVESPVLYSSVNLITREVREVSTTIALRPDDETWRGATWLGADRLVSWAPTLLGCWTGDGKHAWGLKHSDRLANVDDVCTTSNGRLAILDRLGEVGIQFIYPEGRVGPYLHLKEVWGRDRIVPSDIFPAADGGLWIVHWDDHGSRLTRTDSDCRVVQEWIPRYANGSRVRGKPALGPAGEVWVEDGAAFARLDQDGVVNRVVGEAREKAPLRDASMVRFGPDGKIYATDARDHAVHVFDDEGREVRVVRPTSYAEDGITPRGLGDLEWVDKRWYPVGTTNLRWEVEEDVVRLVDSGLGEIRTYRTPESVDGATIFEGAATSPDGALAVTLFRRPEAGHALLHIVILDPDHEEVRKVTLPQEVLWLSSITFDGERIALSNSEFLGIFATDSRSSLKVEFPRSLPGCGMAPDTSPRVDFARSGTEIWIREGDFGTKITRYALP